MKSIMRMSLGAILAVIIFVEGSAIAYNINKNPNKNISGIGYLNPAPYLKALIYPVQKTKIFFPRIVKNGCGKYAVQIKMIKSRRYYSLPDEHPDTSYDYIGIKMPFIYDGGHGFGGSGQITISGGWTIDTINSLKQDNETKIFSGDTIYDASIGYELMFDKERDAYNAMMSYMHKQILVQMFNDSIDNCHNYKP